MREKLMGSADKKSIVEEKEKKVLPATSSQEQEDRPDAGPSTATTRPRNKSRPPPFKPSTTTTALTRANKAPPATAPATKSTFVAPTASSARPLTSHTKAKPCEVTTATESSLYLSCHVQARHREAQGTLLLKNKAESALLPTDKDGFKEAEEVPISPTPEVVDALMWGGVEG
ncbi:hypothetical protein PENSPDRAFT_754016 [Peniophora sp. CONT]|nr:hypothetical protein PENSPDRAFT_754016 [Peniophora sp. CONT]